ncbi:hypothetical protein [Bacillus sinesaloumensis]|uniref:hypothetical protein n=1 Tax=Litchfieldia sinesaloumensis TaxID=1926280 RepID=UPI00098831E8|nr:hypothetical protein [Bacillus sinesaloumensis]
MENYPVGFDQLLKAYQSLWNNRRLWQKDLSSEDILRFTIRRDLLDELTHPRLRKTPYEKFFLACKRIFDSSLPIEEKLSLQHIYLEEMEKVKNV